MSGTEQNELHELLCAYVLGECTEEQRERVETALAESEELRAEKERLEGTIGFVQGAFEGEEALSEEALAKLLEDVEAQAAKPGGAGPRLVPETPIHQIAWYRRPMARAAAALVVIAGGVLGIRSFESGTAVHAPAEQVAQLDKDDEANRRDRAENKMLEAIGYAGKDDASASDVSSGVSTKLESSAAHQAEVESLVALGYATAEPESEEFADASSEEVLDRLAQADAGENMPSTTTPGAAAAAPVAAARVPMSRASEPVTVSEYEQQPAPERAEVGVAGGRVGTVKNAPDGRERFKGGDGNTLAGGSSGPVPPRRQDPGVTTGSDDFFLRLGGKKQDAPRARENNVIAKGGAKDNEVREELSQLGYAQAEAPSPADNAPTTMAGPAPSAERTGEAPANELRKEAESGRFGDEAGKAEGEADAAVDRWLRDDADGEDLRWKKNAPIGGRLYDPAEIERMIERESNRVLRECYRRPNEKPGAMYFRFWGDNSFELAELDRLSTFSVDVDTASYTLARRYLTKNILPEKAQIRTEEFVNYFEPDLPAPTEETFGIHTELAPSLFGGSGQRWMLRVGVRGREVSETERKPLAITFVVDVSGSMRRENRLELVKHAMRLLLSQLDARDSIAIIAYSKEARLILPMTSAAQRGVIESAIHPLRPEGSTNAEAGLKMGYEVALAGLDAAANNRVVFLSDGVANVGQINQDALNADVKRHRDQGIYLNTIGVGLGNHNDVFLEQLANKGDGICDYVDDEAAARRAIVDRFTGAFEPIASDVKIQVDFDPAQVYRYRLLGYENRAIADVDFRNDKVDAGEVGAGHQIVALYEIERTSNTSEETPLATVHLRWKAPKGAGQDPAEVDVTEIERGVSYREAVGSFDATSAGYKKSVLAAQFAEFLRRSTHAAGDSYETLVAQASALQGQLGDAEWAEFVLMTQRAQELILAQSWRRGAYERALDEYRRYQILRCELEQLRRELDAPMLEKLRRQNELLERQIRDLIRREIEERHG